MSFLKRFEVVVLLSLISAVLSVEPLDPEEAAFIFTRCKEDNAGNEQCLVKCLLEKSGSYNQQSGKFEGNLIRAQWKKYPNSVPEEKAKAFADAVDKLGSVENTCEAVAKAYQTIREQYKETAKDLFHGKPEKAKKVYDELGANIKKPGQSVFLFCEDKFYPPGSEKRKEICEMRQFKVLDDETYKKRVQCVYKLLRYITKDDKFDVVLVLKPSELKRDFELVGKDVGRLDAVLEKCKSSEPQDALPLARHYYKCLVDSDVTADYKEAVDYREFRSMDYSYNPKVNKYDKAAVVQKMEELDIMQCPEMAKFRN